MVEPAVRSRFYKAESHVAAESFCPKAFYPVEIARPRAVIIFAAADYLFDLSCR